MTDKIGIKQADIETYKNKSSTVLSMQWWMISTKTINPTKLMIQEKRLTKYLGKLQEKKPEKPSSSAIHQQNCQQPACKTITTTTN